MRSFTISGIRNSRSGFLLLISLWLLAVLTILCWSLIYRVRLSRALADYRNDEVYADALLQAGLARALWALRQDGDVEVDHRGESWSTAPSMVEERLIPGQFLDQPEPAVRWRVVDEGGKINVNTAAPEVLTEILKAYYEFDVDYESLANYIIDWTDSDSEGPAEFDYYVSAQASYEPRNGPLPRLEELLAVRDVTPWLFYGEDRNGNRRLDAEEDDGERRPPNDNQDGELQIGLRNILTASGEGMLNVNTAPSKTLKALFGVFVDPADAEEWATEIDRARSGPDGVLGTEDDTPLKTTQEIAQVIGANLYQRCQNAGVPLEVVSTAFTIEVHVDLEEENLRRRGRGLFLREEQEARLAYWRTGN